MATISLRLSEYEDNLIKNYAALRKMNISELIRQAVLERIEDEYDTIIRKSIIQTLFSQL